MLHTLRGLAFLLSALPALAQTPAPSITRFGAAGGDFQATLSDGRTLRGADLVGATLNLTVAGTPLRLRLDSAEADAGHPDVWLFGMTVIAANGAETPYCLPDPNGRSLAMPYPAADQPLGLAITCSAGATGKCLRFGYRPWAMAPDGVTSLAPYHAACVNLVRAAYGGPPRGWTRDGMAIDIYDHIGIQEPGMAPDHAFEAGWTPQGAVCVAHTRVPENGSVEDVVAAVPRLAGATGAQSCTEARATALGAMLFNRSRPPG